MPIATTLIRGTPPVFPPNFCWETPQQYANALFEFGSWQFQSDIGNSFYNWGDTLPTAENRVYLWFKASEGRWYQFNLESSGKWLSPYTAVPPAAPGLPSGVRWEWEGTEAELNLFDGGDAGAVGLYQGPFWEIDHSYDARSSMGAVPTLPVGGQVFPVGTNLGAEQITQAANQVASHTHAITNNEGILTWDGSAAAKGTSAGNDFDTDQDFVTDANQAVADQQPMSIIHPVRANYKIKRTVRKYYAI